MKKLAIASFVIIVLIAILATPGSSARSSDNALQAAQTRGPGHGQSESQRRDRELQKLAPELRGAATRGTDQVFLVTVLHSADTLPGRHFERHSRGNSLGELGWSSGQIRGHRLLELVAEPGVLSVISTETFQPLAMPAAETAVEAQDVHVGDVHNAGLAHSKGFDGQGVTVAVVDTGVDFSHPELQGTQARISGSAYDGWPFAYDTLSGLNYSWGGYIAPDNIWSFWNNSGIVKTLPILTPSCDGTSCTATLSLDISNATSHTFTFPDTSLSGNYRYSVNPDPTHMDRGDALGLGYAVDDVPAAVIVADENQAGVYDSVYVDLDFDQDLTDEKAQRKGDELAGFDYKQADGTLGQDGVVDIGAGMLTWISDGVNHPPGIAALYNVDTQPIASSGELIVFVWDEDGHGTMVAGSITSQSVLTDPDSLRITNPLVAGGSAVGGAGGPVMAGIAPGARIAALQNGLYFPLESWIIASLGMDGIPNTGDEAQLVNNSFANAYVTVDGWDYVSRFVYYLNAQYALNTTFLASTGNYGHGYGTNVQPSGGSIIDVGASTLHGTLDIFEVVYEDQLTYGNIAPWSNRGPTASGDFAPDVACVGSYAKAPLALNTRSQANGEEAYAGFVGTSLSTPLCTGVLALGYQAFMESHGRWPTWQEAHMLLTAGATDLGQDVLSQGAGSANADRTTDIATGDTVFIDQFSEFPLITPAEISGFGNPSQWLVGDYNGSSYVTFPNIAQAGETYSQTFTVHNPTDSALNVNLSDGTLTTVYEETLTVNWDSFSGSTAIQPHYLLDVTDLIDTHAPDMLRAQIVFPYGAFDTDGDNNDEDGLNVFFYDWKDLNLDGNLWTDDDADGVVDAGEIDKVIDPGTGLEAFEYNRMNSGYHYGGTAGTALEASLSHDSINRQHDGIFLGIQRSLGSEALTFEIRLTAYKRTDWSWLSLPSTLNIPAGSDATFTANMAIPAATAPGVYQGAIVYGSSSTALPILVHVAGSSSGFEFGSSSLTAPRSGVPYENGHVFGAFNWDGGFESGDWRFYYYDVPAGSGDLGKTLVVDVEWTDLLTDLDVYVLGAVGDPLSDLLPDLFGPQSMGILSVGNVSNITNGKHNFSTSSGGSRQTVAAGLDDGLGAIALRSVLFGGADFSEPFVGNAFVVHTAPYAVLDDANGTAGQPYNLSWTQTVTVTQDLPGGLMVSTTEPELTVSGVPSGPITAGTPVTFNVDYAGIFTPGSSWYGYVQMGPDYAPQIIDVPVDINMVDPNAPLTASIDRDNHTVTADETAVISFEVTNHSETAQLVEIDLTVPATVAWVPGTESATTGTASLVGNMVEWNATLAAHETVVVSAVVENVSASGKVVIDGSVSAVNTGQYIALQTKPKFDPYADLEATPIWVVQGGSTIFSMDIHNSLASNQTVDLDITLPSLLDVAPGTVTTNAGAAGYVAANHMINWQGVIAPGQTIQVSAELTAGSGIGFADITTVYKVNGVKFKPNIIVHVNPDFGATLTPADQAGLAEPGQTANYSLLVTNQGDYTDSFDLATSGTSWATSLPASVGPLLPGQSANIQLDVTVPGSATGGSIESVIVSAVSQSDPRQSTAASTQTTVDVSFEFEISPGQQSGMAAPNSAIYYTLTLTNTGNSADSFVIGIASAWLANGPALVGPLSAGESTSFYVDITVPGAALGGEGDAAVVTATSTGDSEVFTSAQLDSSSADVYGLMLSPTVDGHLASPGEMTRYNLQITNQGNVADSYSLSMASAWNASAPINTGLIQPGQNVMVDIDITVPALALSGEQDLAQVTVSSDNEASLIDTALLTTTADSVFAGEVASETDMIMAEPGSEISFNVVISNTGNSQDSYDIVLTGNEWAASAPTGTGPVSAGGVSVVSVTVIIPANAEANSSDYLAVEVTSQGNGSMIGSASLTAMADTIYGLNVTPVDIVQKGNSGARVTYVIELTNLGNITDTFIVTLQSSTWIVTAPDPVQDVAPGETRTVEIDVVIPPGKNKGDTNVAVLTVSSQGAAQAQRLVTLETVTLTTVVEVFEVFLPIIQK
jgi:uncharacterized membrane protein